MSFSKSNEEFTKSHTFIVPLEFHQDKTPLAHKIYLICNIQSIDVDYTNDELKVCNVLFSQ